MASAPAVEEHVGHGPLHHQFENLDQQNEAYLVGMWSFLITEIMLFGGLFAAYSIYRYKYQTDFYIMHEQLDVRMGGTNTVVLLISSFFMVLGVHFAQLKDRTKTLASLSLTILCAAAFLVIKYFEYSAKFQHHLFPGYYFLPDAEHLNGANANAAQLFMSLYFAMTGLHAIHILIGMVCIGTIMTLWVKRSKVVTEDYIPTELVGLYWHFVDVVWIFLFPLFYLIPK